MQQYVKTGTRVSVIIIVLLALISCQGAYYDNLAPELVPLARYDEALTTLVSVKTSFVAAIKAEPNAMVRARLLDIAEPLFKRTDTALTVWKQFIDAGVDPAAKIRAYQTIWLELVNALLQMGIVEVN